MAPGTVVDRALMNLVLISRRVVGNQLNVRVLREKGFWMSDKSIGGRDASRRVGEGRMVVKMRKLNVASRENWFQQGSNVEYGNVRGQVLLSAEEEWETFRYAVLRCSDVLVLCTVWPGV